MWICIQKIVLIQPFFEVQFAKCVVFIFSRFRAFAEALKDFTVPY